jgi:hypothetical protein
VTTSLYTRTKNLWEDFGTQETLLDVQRIKNPVQFTWRVLETRLVEVEARSEHGYGGSTGTGACAVRPPKFEGSCFADNSRPWSSTTTRRTYLPPCRVVLPRLYTVSIWDRHTRTLSRQLRVAMGTTTWPQPTAFGWKQGTNSPGVCQHHSADDPRRPCCTTRTLRS